MDKSINYIDITDICKFLDGYAVTYKYNRCNAKINSCCSLNDLKDNSLTWIKILTEENKKMIADYNDLLVFTDMKYYDEKVDNTIFVNNLKTVFFSIVKHFFSELDIDIKKPNIEKTANVLSRQYGEGLYVGNNSFVDKNVIIGKNVTIMNNVVIQGNVIIGNNVFIESGSNIGVCGFGYYKNEYGKPVKVPHIGGVVIGNDVVVGAGTCICRGSLDNTIIHDNVKIDNLCHIAHSVKLENGVMVAACSEISGSTVIGEDTWIAPGVTIINGTTIGNNVYTGIATNIVKDVPDNTLIYGNPGKIKEKK